ncbi:MAG TPA: hypothetical protein VFR75_04250 [Solirubrobacterales bacterium]|nr:hypothetical protein [Solirubrobacterales bacterium]
MGTTQLDIDFGDSAVRGLATVAMLKVNFDAGRDHIAMFEPFVRDAVASFPNNDMDRKQLIGSVLDRHGLALPENTMRTLLGRLVRKKYLRKEGGRYFRTDQVLESEDVLQSRRKAEERQGRLADELIARAAKRGVKIETRKDALSLIVSFMEAYHVRLAFDEPPDFDGTHQEDTSRSTQHVVTALFLRDVVSSQGELSEVVQEMLEGFVLQNTLLLKDIAHASRQFQDLEVILDSQILFGALGVRGPMTETAPLELLELLRQTGATVSAFEPTLREMKRILMVYEGKIGTSKGRESLYPGDLTRHFLEGRYTPSDVKQCAALLEANLKASGITLRSLPDRVPRWTMNEKVLARALADESGRDDEPRVVHDIDCVAGVLTYRQGATNDQLDTSGAIFVTDSGMTVSRIQNWYKSEGGKGFPPIIHELSLSNYAWLKRPASAAKLKVHELVALCSAALRPSRKAWQHFVNHLRSLEESGQLSSDEVAAVVASELTQNVLAETGIDEESDAESLSEVIERVKADYKRKADAAVSAANRAAEDSDREAQELRIQIGARAASLARVLCLSVTALLTLSLVVGTAISLIAAATGEAPSGIAVLLAVGPLAIFGLLGVLSGFQLKGWRGDSEARLARKLETWMLHGRFCPPPSEAEQVE